MEMYTIELINSYKACNDNKGFIATPKVNPTNRRTSYLFM
jgi:hypothetical protein